MKIDTKLVSTVQKLISVEPALLDDLQQATNGEQAVEYLVAAGNRHGIGLDATELTAVLQALEASAAIGELSDEQLAGVDGGTGKRRIYRDIIEHMNPMEMDDLIAKHRL